MSEQATQFVYIETANRSLGLEYVWVGPARQDAQVVVFLHEGLGSVSMWKDFPERLCARLRMRGLVYSRFGYGRSTPRPHDEPFAPDYLHREATEVLPAVLDALGIARPWLFGHSDGGTIALLAAARVPERVAGIVVAAPHIFVEDVTIEGLKRAREAYQTQGLRKQLARYHQDADSVFYGWNDIWLAGNFRGWNIESEIAAIRCPVLAMQGEDDEYASLEQIRGIQRKVRHTQLLVLPRCGHIPHRDNPEAVMEAAAAFMRGAPGP